MELKKYSFLQKEKLMKKLKDVKRNIRILFLQHGILGIVIVPWYRASWYLHTLVKQTLTIFSF